MASKESLLAEARYARERRVWVCSATAAACVLWVMES